MNRTILLRAVQVLALGAAVAAATACDKKADADDDYGSLASLASATGQLRVTADEHGFTPSSISIPKGAPGSKATVTFVRTTDKTCATEVVFPDLGVTRPLPLNVPVEVQVPTDAARRLGFHCGMGMFKGALVVSDKTR